MNKFKIINKEDMVDVTFDHECDLCNKPNYPIISWRTDDDPYINSFVCTECITSVLNGAAERI